MKGAKAASKNRFSFCEMSGKKGSSSQLKIRSDIVGNESAVSPRSESELSDEPTSPRSDSSQPIAIRSSNGGGGVAGVASTSSSPQMARGNVPAAGSRARKMMESDSANISLSGNLKVNVFRFVGFYSPSDRVKNNVLFLLVYLFVCAKNQIKSNICLC